MGFYQLLWASLVQLTYPSSLGLMGLPSALYFLCLHYFGLTIAHSYFSTSHTTHWFATSIFLNSFRPVCFLKAHLLILQAYYPLFLPLGLNGFSIHLLTLFCPCSWASSFYWASQNDHQQPSKENHPYTLNVSTLVFFFF